MVFTVRLGWDFCSWDIDTVRCCWENDGYPAGLGLIVVVEIMGGIDSTRLL